MFESVQGGRDYGERPSFYVAYDAAQAAKTYAKTKLLENFIKKYPSKQAELDKLQAQLASGAKLFRYLPITARQDWVAVLNSRGEIVGYIQGDGF
jgi:chemotaxis receptor (MCP) glutamine deamidase CheD